MTYRNIDIGMWTDSKFEGLSMYGKLMWLYLLTAPQGNMAGCFEVSYRRIEVETGLTEQQARKAMAELCRLNVLSRHEETSEVLIRNWGKYNCPKSPNVKKSVRSSIEKVRCKEFRDELVTWYDTHFNEPFANPSETVTKGSVNPPFTVTDTDNDNVNVTGGKSTRKTSQVGTGEPKHKHGEFSNILLTDKELEKLKDRFPNDWQSRIDDLSYYIGSTGKSYSSHYRTILSWNRKNASERKEASADADKWAKYRD